MRSIFAHNKPFKIQLPNKYELQNGFNPDNKGSLVWYTKVPKQMKVLVLECMNGTQKRP